MLNTLILRERLPRPIEEKRERGEHFIESSREDQARKTPSPTLGTARFQRPTDDCPEKTPSNTENTEKTKEIVKYLYKSALLPDFMKPNLKNLRA
ncbi:MAG: hypothetical protein ACLFU8_13315, partial [Anaerolineales bacterium]